MTFRVPKIEGGLTLMTFRVLRTEGLTLMTFKVLRTKGLTLMTVRVLRTEEGLTLMAFRELKRKDVKRTPQSRFSAYPFLKSLHVGYAQLI